MREIKFRAWNKKYNCMMEWEKDIKGITIGGIKTVRSYTAEYGWIDTYSLDEVELMQYTGLKDRNCKEIYEGDILQIYILDDDEILTDLSIVSMSDRGFWKVTYISEFYNEEFLHEWCGEDIEVIGNIYENPELLDWSDTND